MIKFLKPRTFANLVIYSLCLCIIISSIFIISVSKILTEIIKKSLTEIATQGAYSVSLEMKGYLDSLERLALTEDIYYSDNSINMNILLNEVENKKFQRIVYSDLKGNGITTDGKKLYVGDKGSFYSILKGQRSVFGPILDETNKKMVIIFAVPVYHYDEMSGVLFAEKDIEILYGIIDRIRFSGKGNSFIIDQYGTTIAHDDINLVYNRDNDFQNIKDDYTLRDLVKLEEKMIQRETGAGEYYYKGVHKYLGFAPIEGTKWSLAVAAPKSVIFKDYYRAMQIIGCSLVFILVAALGLALFSFLTKKQMAELEKNAKETIVSAGILEIELDELGYILGVNANVVNKLGYSSSDIVGKNINQYSLDDIQTFLDSIIKGKQTELNLFKKDNKTVYILWNLRNYNANKNSLELIGVDISDKIQLQEKLQNRHEQLTRLFGRLAASQEELRKKYEDVRKAQKQTRTLYERYKLVVEGAKDAIIEWGENINNIIYISERFYELLGYTREEFHKVHSNFLDAIHPDDNIRLSDSYCDYLNGLIDYFSAEFRLRMKNGEYKWFLLHGKSSKNGEGKIIRNAGSLTDITQRKIDEQQITELAYFDYLTGLPNKVCLVEEMEFCCTKNDCFGAVMFIDIDNFKFINDTFGHPFGDKLLKLIAQKFTAIDVEDVKLFFSRFGGDEFVILVDKPKDKETIKSVANKIIHIFKEPFQLEGNSLYITCSVGIAMYPDNGMFVEELFKNADIAMYKVKERGKNRYLFYNEHMGEAILKKLDIENSLRLALVNNELRLHYQPQVDSKSGRIVGFEALIRWESSSYGKISPNQFIPIAEESGLIVEIGNWVFENACLFISKINNGLTTPLSVSVNVSSVELIQEDFIGKVIKTINKYQVEPSLVGIEITEGTLIESFQLVIDKLKYLKQLGFKIYLDDFGIGYSSLTYLKKLPIDIVKIDKSFVKDIEQDNIEKNLLESIIHLTQSIGLKVVVEGVETTEQCEFLKNSNCNFLQGYLISYPLPEEDIIRMLSSHIY